MFSSSMRRRRCWIMMTMRRQIAEEEMVVGDNRHCAQPTTADGSAPPPLQTIFWKYFKTWWTVFWGQNCNLSFWFSWNFRVKNIWCAQFVSIFSLSSIRAGFSKIFFWGGAICSKMFLSYGHFLCTGWGREGGSTLFQGCFPPYKRVSYITNLSTKQLVPTDAGG